MLNARALAELDSRCITLAILDAEFATMVATAERSVETVDVTALPSEVVQGCLWIERRLKQRRE